MLLQKTEKIERCALLDTLRGLTVISMVLYHAMWDLCYLFGWKVLWFKEIGGYLWQQATCCAFILLAGFCAAMGRHTVRRGIYVLLLGTGITLVTMVFMPKERILFGVLTLLGSCMFLTGLLKPYLLKIPSWSGLLLSGALFMVTRPINQGGLGVFSKVLAALPEGLYRNHFTAYLGFPHEAFFSTDYFSLMPWIFLFFVGFFLYQVCGKNILAIHWRGIGWVNVIGCHSLLIYVVHQPLLYALLNVWNG